MPKLERAVVPLIVDVMGGTETKGAPSWLIRPGRAECGDRWSLVCSLYRRLEANALPDVMPTRESRRVDAVLTTPDGAKRIIEVDEYQHFNPHRAATLRLYPKLNPAAFDLNEWLKKCDAVHRLPGVGFGRPRPPLFPGDGGRHRQRAFRDALCDLLPPLYGFQPTLRIAHFEVENWIEASDARARMIELLRQRGVLSMVPGSKAKTPSNRRRERVLLARSTKQPLPIQNTSDIGELLVNDDPIPSILAAAAYAAEKHRNQRRKDKDASPYINHPIAVARVLACEARERDGHLLAAALLHDTVEDTDTSFGDLEEHFGKVIASVVREVTDDKSLPKEERKRLQIKHAAQASRPAKLVKLADKICNLRDIQTSPPADWSPKRKRDYFDWAKRVVDEVRGVHPSLEQLFDAEYAGGRRSDLVYEQLRYSGPQMQSPTAATETTQDGSTDFQSLTPMERELLRSWYGYGRWDAPYWFIGQEPGGDELDACVRRWVELGKHELVDIVKHHAHHERRWFDEPSPTQPTWAKLIWLILSYKGGCVVGQTPSRDDTRRYQKKQLGRRKGETALLELSSYPASKSRMAVPRTIFQEERISTIRRRVQTYKPEIVVFYSDGQEFIDAWRQIAGTKLTPNQPQLVGSTAFVITAHPTRARSKAYWVNMAQQLREVRVGATPSARGSE